MSSSSFMFCNFMPSTIQKRYSSKYNTIKKEPKTKIKSTSHSPSIKKRRRASIASQSSHCFRRVKTKPDDFEDLMSQLDYSYDALATINVIFDSLRHTYTNCKSKIEQQMTDARLCDMEKELLIAYDDLNLQIVHLEKDISLMEEKMVQLKSTHQDDSASSLSSSSSNDSSPSMLSMPLFDTEAIECSPNFW